MDSDNQVYVFLAKFEIYNSLALACSFFFNDNSAVPGGIMYEVGFLGWHFSSPERLMNVPQQRFVIKTEMPQSHERVKTMPAV